MPENQVLSDAVEQNSCCSRRDAVEQIATVPAPEGRLTIARRFSAGNPHLLGFKSRRDD